MLSLTVKKLDAFKFDGVAESDNTGNCPLLFCTFRPDECSHDRNANFNIAYVLTVAKPKSLLFAQ